MKLIIASNNKHKIVEIKQILAGKFEEILSLKEAGVTHETLEDQDLLHRLHAGVILTGGGSRTKDIGTLAQQVLGMNVRHGRPIHVDGLDKEEFPPALAAISGALLYAHRNYEEKSILDGLFGRFFK